MLFSTSIPEGTPPDDNGTVRPTLSEEPKTLPVTMSFRKFITEDKSPDSNEIRGMMECAGMTPDQVLALTFTPVPYTKPTEEEETLLNGLHREVLDSLKNGTVLSTEYLEQLSGTPLYSTMEKLWYSLAAAATPRYHRASHALEETLIYASKSLLTPMVGKLSSSTIGKRTAGAWREELRFSLGYGVASNMLSLGRSDNHDLAAMRFLKFVLGWRINFLTTLADALTRSEMSLSTAELINILAATAPSKEFITEHSYQELFMGVLMAAYRVVAGAPTADQHVLLSERWSTLHRLEPFRVGQHRELMQLLPSDFAMVEVPHRRFTRYYQSSFVPSYTHLLFLAAYHAKVQSTKHTLGAMNLVPCPVALESKTEFIFPDTPPRILKGADDSFAAEIIEAFTVTQPPLPGFPTTLYTLQLNHVSNPKLPFIMQKTDYGALRLLFPTDKVTVNSLLRIYGAPQNRSVAELPQMLEALLTTANDTHGDLLYSFLNGRLVWEEGAHKCPIEGIDTWLESIYVLLDNRIDDEAKMYNKLNIFRAIDFAASPSSWLPSFAQTFTLGQQEAAADREA